MNRDDIIRMARECFADPDGSLALLTPELERFAALVAAAEREECAQAAKGYLTSARFDHRHIDLGDIRLTIGDQTDLESTIRARGKE